MNTREPNAVRTPTSPGTFSTAARMTSFASPSDRVSPTFASRASSSDGSTITPPPCVSDGHAPGGSVFISP